MAKKREVPTKNYYYLLGLTVVTVFLLFYLVNWYQAKQEYLAMHSSISEVLSEVKEEELDNYLLDNPNTVIYFASFQGNSLDDFEKDLKKYLLKEELTDSVVVVDTDKITNQDFYSSFVQKYFVEDLTRKNINLNYLPNMVVIKEGKVRDVLFNYETTINIDEVRHFFVKNGVTDL